MITTGSDSLALNPQGMDDLRLQAKNGSKESVHAAAAQFESYFMQMMLRSMRQTLSQDGPFDSQETKTFSEMFDQQISQTISKGKGIGLADMLAKQMELSMQPKSVISLQPRKYDLPPVVPQPPAVNKPLKSGDMPLGQIKFDPQTLSVRNGSQRGGIATDLIYESKSDVLSTARLLEAA